MDMTNINHPVENKYGENNVILLILDNAGNDTSAFNDTNRKMICNSKMNTIIKKRIFSFSVLKSENKHTIYDNKNTKW
jgi:hypothetical protein